ncbi:zinc finger, CCHC-type containing protein [Tanacetum coccineum]
MLSAGGNHHLLQNHCNCNILFHTSKPIKNISFTVRSSSSSLTEPATSLKEDDDWKVSGPVSFPPLKVTNRVVLVRHGQSTWNAVKGGFKVVLISPFLLTKAKPKPRLRVLIDDSFNICFSRIRVGLDRLENPLLLSETEVEGLILTPYKAEGPLEAVSLPSGRGKTVYILPPSYLVEDEIGPLKRSKRTADVIWDSCKEEILTDSDLREIDLYSFQGLIKHEGVAKFGEALVHDSRSVLVVAHNAVNQALVSTAMGTFPFLFLRAGKWDLKCLKRCRSFSLGLGGEIHGVFKGVRRMGIARLELGGSRGILLDQKLLQTVREFHACKQKEGQSVISYVLKMKSYIDNLEHLGHAMTQNLSHGEDRLSWHAMLKLHEQTLPPKEVAPALHAIRAGRIQKNQKKKSHKAAKGNQGKGKAKMGNALVPAPSFAPKPKNPPTPKKDNPAKDAICHQCGEVGHWRRNCPIYLAELMKKKKLSQGASTSGIFTIELYSFPSTSWVYDTGCGTHICITTQGLRGSRKLKPGALSLYVGDGHRAAVEAIGEFHLCLPSGLVLILHNCHYAPSITRGIISVSRLYKDGFVNRFENDNSISVSKNNLIYFNAIPRDDIYEIVLSSSNTNDSSMYAVSNKRAKLNLDSALLWHCRLGHISKKRIEKLQHDGLLDSTDIKSFEKCVSCMSGKMARKPYSHQVERAKDLLGLIHTDVCGPFKIMSRQGAYYFVTFTDDFSRYGYVYLLKHKHEVFETFKVFQKEVENQLGKTIKSLRSDRGGEYMSQEFLDHLKDHGIIAHRTPPYTPQHNGVSERRNRTLLDMVRSMMSQTTLPKSFWDYALESAARILNMVPTKKVDKTPYEVWHGLSYLKV